jgi:hypothetical protein
MGLFLSMSGVARASWSDVEDALSAYARERGGLFQAAEGPFESPNVLAITEGKAQRLTVLYPWEFVDWDDASAFLSRTLGSPIFSLHIHDEDLWMYVLYSCGEEVDRFNPIPDYWSDEMSEEEYAWWLGDASEIARVWPSVEEEEIRNYLVRWNLDDEEPGKAYPDDRHHYLDCFQVTDFMRRLGLVYPLDQRGKAIGRTYRFEVPSPG